MPKTPSSSLHFEGSDSSAILRLSIEGSWTATDMVESFAAVRDLYNLRLMLGIEYQAIRAMERMYFDFPEFPPLRRHIQRRAFSVLAGGSAGQLASHIDTKTLYALDSLVFPEERLLVRRVRYSSPGIKDLVGIGEIVAQVRGFIEKLIDLYSSRRQRTLENERREVELERMRIDNAREYVSLARDCGYSELQIREMIDWTDKKQRRLARLVRESKIQEVSLVEDHEKP